MAWAKNGTETRTTTTTTIALTLTAAKKFNVFLQHSVGNSYQNLHSFNTDTSTVYASRYSDNGGTDGTDTSATHLAINGGSDSDGAFAVIYTCSISGEEKLVIGNLSKTSTAGAGTAPDRVEEVGKYVPSPDADITQIQVTNGLGTYGVDSNISALGTD